MNNKNNLDEMQEQKLLKIEHNTVWIVFWGLLAAIVVQTVLGGENMWQSIAGEWIVFICMAGYLVAACLKNGIWDRKLKPNPKTNIVASLIAGFACGVIFFGMTYSKYQNKLMGSIATGVFIFIFVFVLSMVALTISASLHKKRVDQLETIDEKESDQ